MKTCICNNINHFPIVLSYKENSYIKLTNEGIDINNLRKTSRIIKVYNTILQIKCIISILNQAGIEHLDLNTNGKNICINNSGKISLIDFDICYIKILDKKLNNIMIERLNRHRQYDTFKHILNILIKTKNLILL